MDQGTQQNAAMVEESTAASHNLANEVDALNRRLTTSRTGEPLRNAPPRYGMMPRRPLPGPEYAVENSKGIAASGNAAIAQSADSWEEF
ncbi:MAG: chemotaxis protein [Rhizobium sp.]|nr:chemotaxis protein [Rhizobium sp.]